ncbi:MAG: PKD domain-containing protein [Nitrospirota bacterium]|nr:PKD domain-containing protein [Nitrospirota bacterium]
MSVTTLPLQNQSPVISSLTANPSTVNPNSTSTVTCSASDPDNDPLTYSWAATGGTILPGSGSVATWTAPSTSGTYTVTCTVSDGKGGTASKGVNITVTESTTPLSITTTSLPSGTVGVSYGTNLSATGGKTPYTWSIMSGNLPPGLSPSTGGLISGTPTTAGTYNFTVKVTDSSSPQQTAPKALSISVNQSGTPTVNSVNPVSGKQGETLSVTISGANLSGATSISFGAGITVNGFTVNSSSQITANISISPTATVGLRNVSVTTPAGTGTGNGLFTINSPNTFTLSVTKAGTGSGTVTSSPAGINCGSTCSASFNQGTTVTLTPTPATGSTFAGWSGACSGTGTCTVTMDGNKNVTAIFNTTTPTIPSTPTGTSPGTTSSPGTITSSTTVTLSWSAVSGATYYSFGVRDMITNLLVVDMTNYSSTSYSTTLSAGGQYRWNVAACNSAGCSNYTTPLYFRHRRPLLLLNALQMAAFLPVRVVGY